MKRVAIKEIIISYRRTRNAVVTAKELGISRWTVYRWVKKGTSIAGYTKTYRYQGIERHSTRPRHVKRALSLKEESAIISLRQRKPYTAEKVKYLLHLSASIRTIHRRIKAKGLTHRYGNHRRPKYQKTIHMHLKNTFTIGKLQMDVKYLTPELTGLPYTCFEYAVVDIYSRYKDAVILNQLDQDGAILALLEMRKRLPFMPDFIQTDNGLEFQGRFHQYCVDSGLKHHLIHKRTPNENAVIERTFRTDEEEFFFMMERAPKDYDELRVWFAAFLHEYNYERPHLGINLKTPMEVIKLLQMS